MTDLAQTIDNKNVYDRAISDAIWFLPERETGSEHFLENSRAGLRRQFGSVTGIEMMSALAGVLVDRMFTSAEEPERMTPDGLMQAEATILAALITANATRVGKVNP